MSNLSLRQERFVTAYLGESRGNASEAARAAGYKDGQQSGYECLKNEAVRARIEDRLSTEALSAGIILAELSAVALSPTAHFMQVIRPADDEHGIPMTVKLDYSAKTKALELLGKFHGLWVDRQDVRNQTIVREYADGPDLSKLTTEELREYRRLVAKTIEGTLPAPQGGY